MLKIMGSFYNWLHGRWPAGTVEKLPVVGENGKSNLKGVRVVGDLTGIPLLKFSADSGARAIRAILEEPDFVSNRGKDQQVLDVAIIGAGVSGVAAAMEAQKAGLRFKLFEATQIFSTVANFPKGKPIYTYPTDMTPAGDLQFRANNKEDLLKEMDGRRLASGIEPVFARIEKVQQSGDHVILHHGDHSKTSALRVIVAIGRSGNFRKLGCPGEDLDKVSNRLHDPKDYAGKNVLVVGGGDSAMEAAIALATCGAHVTLSYRKKEFARPKPENIAKIEELTRKPDSTTVCVDCPSSERVTTAAFPFMRGDNPPGSLQLALGSTLEKIEADKVILKTEGVAQEIPNQQVFAMIGREAPLDFFRRSGINIHGEFRWAQWASLVLMCLLIAWIYHWKSDYKIPFGLQDTFNQYFGLEPGYYLQSLQGWWNDPGTLGHTLKISASSRSFYYSLFYTVIIAVFGVRRILHRKTPYVTAQTSSLFLIQAIPLFLLPEILLPWLGHNGWFDGGWGKNFADAFFPDAGYGHGREYWRAYGFILAWPLMAWNWFNAEPLYAWLALGFVQTFILIPLLVYYYGKGAYCGWVCSCGAMAETLGDRHRNKMPHGPIWNKLNMIGQVFLAFAAILMMLKIAGWSGVGWAETAYLYGSKKIEFFNYDYFVDLLFAGVLGVAFYFHFSGRVWCRFACPLAALMHLYARFSRFRIFSEKSKCISCNVCTSVCHQGIDIMNFANKGLPMQDPQCVRCSACVQQCPTGVLSFGRYGAGGKIVFDSLAASPLRMRES